MNLRRPKSLNFILHLQLVKDRSGVNDYDEDIIGMRPDVILASLAPPNPYIQDKKSWLKSHCLQGMQ